MTDFREKPTISDYKLFIGFIGFMGLCFLVIGLIGSLSGYYRLAVMAGGIGICSTISILLEARGK